MVIKINWLQNSCWRLSDLKVPYNHMIKYYLIKQNCLWGTFFLVSAGKIDQDIMPFNFKYFYTPCERPTQKQEESPPTDKAFSDKPLNRKSQWRNFGEGTQFALPSILKGKCGILFSLQSWFSTVTNRLFNPFMLLPGHCPLSASCLPLSPSHPGLPGLEL